MELKRAKDVLVVVLREGGRIIAGVWSIGRFFCCGRLYKNDDNGTMISFLVIGLHNLHI